MLSFPTYPKIEYSYIYIVSLKERKGMATVDLLYNCAYCGQPSGLAIRQCSACKKKDQIKIINKIVRDVTANITQRPEF